MSKAVQGAVMLAGSAALLATGVGAFGVAAEAWFSSGMFATHLMEGLALSGISMEAGAIADALTQQRGQNISTRQPAAFRQVIVGEQRVGGTIIYQSTTGSTHRQYNMVIVIAGHECDSIVNLYLDGRRVNWLIGSTGNTTRNGVNFGGEAGGGDFTGPDGNTYNFNGLVYCEAKFGDQLPGDVIGALTANDPNWAADVHGSPYVGGCTYVYLKVRYDDAQFPQLPEVRFTVRGKNSILDPRTGTRGYSNNWALLVADALTDTEFGLGCDEDEVYEGGAGEQLIAAANVCDELVAFSGGGGGTEKRYTLNWHYDTSMAPGDVIAGMMPAAAGRISRIGGEWYIWPAYWQGPSFAFNKSALTGGVQWNPERSLRERFNRVQGTYIAPNYPYNVAGNLYDSNGWYGGTIANRWPFAFQPTNYPMYAADENHGYPVDQYLIEDTPNLGNWDSGTTYAKGDVVLVSGAFFKAKVDAPDGTPSDTNPDWTAYAGNILPKEISLQGVLSISQAQRVAKIYLMRNRMQGNGVLPMNLEAFGMQPTDTMEFTFPELGWTSKVLEITGTDLTQDDQDGAVVLGTRMQVQETAASVYEWDSSEELDVYNVPASSINAPSAIDPPSGLIVTSGVSTSIVQPDGSVLLRARLDWTVPQDARVNQIQVMHKLSTDSTWTDDGSVDIAVPYAFVPGVVADGIYSFRIRSMTPWGLGSAWVEVDAVTISRTLSSQTNTAVAQQALTGAAFTGGTASIIVAPFTFRWGTITVSCLSANYTITGLDQGSLYYVYFIDPTLAGGAITPISTQDPTDFLGKPGYVYIGAIFTPNYVAPGTGRYYPSLFADVGTQTSTRPEQAYDGDLTTSAALTCSGQVSHIPDPSDPDTFTAGSGLWSGFPNFVTATDLTLHVVASRTSTALSYFSTEIKVSIGGIWTTLTSAVTATATDYTATIPSGTRLDQVSVQATISFNGGAYGGAGSHTFTFEMDVDEIYIEG